MDRKRRKNVWKVATVFGYLGMNIGPLLITTVIPLSLICMGETNFENLAERVKSFKPFSYWLIGIGGITFFVSSLAVIAALAMKRPFQIFVSVGLVINVGLAIALVAWGLVPSEDRINYFHDAWNDADTETRNILQNYYSCCGFESANEYRVKPTSCYPNESFPLHWPNGCYDRITSLTIQPLELTNREKHIGTIGEPKIHILLLAYLLPLAILIGIQFSTAVLFISGLVNTKDKGYEINNTGQKQSETYANEDAVDDFYGNGEENGHSRRKEFAKRIHKIQTDINGLGVSGTNNTHQVKEMHDKAWYKRISHSISSGLENGFYWLGKIVGRNPKKTIFVSVPLAVTFSVGLLQRADQPSGSGGFLSERAQIIEEYIASRQTFSIVDREQFVIVVDDGNNLLTEEKFKIMLDIDRKIRKINGTKGRTFSDFCSRSAGICKERSLFEFWSFNHTLLSKVSSEDILAKLTGNLVSPVFRDEVDISTVLGEIIKDTNGSIIKAKAHIMHYVVSRKDDDWEKGFTDIRNSEYDGVSVYVYSRGSRSMESGKAFDELPLLFAGFGLIFIYIILMTGRFSLLKHRVYIAMMGVVTAGLSMGAGIGLSASLGFEWSVIHLVGPFLIIGIGVDDMFILLQAWDNVDDDPTLRKLPLPERAGHALKAAGVSITVTSITDLVAFAVGASSEISSFASFSVYVATSIILLFFLQCTLFLACTVLDQKRRDERYDACLACCYKHGPKYRASECSKRQLFATFFEDVLGKIVQYRPFQIVVILLTLGLTGFMAWGFSMLKVGFDPDWYLPQDSYVISFDRQRDSYFSAGQAADIFVIDADFYEERQKLHTLYEKLTRNPGINQKFLTSWFENYANWMVFDKNVSDIYADDAFENSREFYASVKEFIQGKGKAFASELAFRGGKMIGSKFHLEHRKVEDNYDHVHIMDSLHEECDSVGFSGRAFPFHIRYFTFSIIKVIRSEVYRNIGITLLCVFLIVLPTIASFQMSLWVALCVVFTTIDVAGSMHFAGLTIEASTIIALLLSIGLAVDYAAHIAHKFLTLKGTRKMRSRVTMGQIGPAVFNGGFSTFLALVLLAGSDTYSYKVLFTIFVCVVGYGLWNGLIFLPCVLGLLGPPPYATATDAKLSQRHQLRKNKGSNDAEETDEIPPNPYLERN